MPFVDYNLRGMLEHSPAWADPISTPLLATENFEGE